MQLYIFPPSPNSLCCQATANQAGIELELIPMNLPGGDHMNPEYLKVNPNHKVPTLVDGEFTLWESGAIMLYLAQQAPDSKQIPDDPRQRAEMMQWMFWRSAHFGPACSIYIFENLLKKMLNTGDPDPVRLEKADEEFNRYASVLNEHLQGREYIVGDSVTLADHTLAAWLIHAEAAVYPMEEYTEVARWSQGILSSAAWKKALSVIPAQ